LEHGRPIRHPRSRVCSMFFLSLTSITRHVEQCSRCCASVGLHFEQCWRQRVPSCSILNMTWTFMMSITSLQFAVHLDPASTWAQVGPKIAQLEELFGGSPGPSWAQPGPILHVYLHYFHCFFPFDEGSCKAMFPTLGLSWAQLRQMPPHRTNSCVLSPTCRTPVGLKLGPSWSLAQVRPKLACDQVWPQSAFGWAK
jgi:hypothetical protein